jgi:hypothetical protein
MCLSMMDSDVCVVVAGFQSWVGLVGGTDLWNVVVVMWLSMLKPLVGLLLGPFLQQW